MSRICPHCGSSNIRQYYFEQIKGAAIDIVIEFARAAITGTTTHNPNTHFSDTAEILYKCKSCGTIFNEKDRSVSPHLHSNQSVYRITDTCCSCGTCIDECPVGAISEGDIYVIDADSCVGCGTCAGVCPNEAIVED